eukprot:gnl/MRDRNA2_/MRDRNA2_102061_c0_seq1.p1 gnl/MRDRNA2_/MRDRNA2_102061_c0~~gnl/MRDRNA2_/MRDRNA2_102061_c0_seq1.p1  ORF type:complete len:201 (+),score=46.37 gnl/MRDRNA2_/MRDRNA2_102061_c0_seq1:49-651(+)
MRCIAVLIQLLIAFVAQYEAKDLAAMRMSRLPGFIDKLADQFVSKLIDERFKRLKLASAKLDNTTLADEANKPVETEKATAEVQAKQETSAEKQKSLIKSYVAALSAISLAAAGWVALLIFGGWPIAVAAAAAGMTGWSATVAGGPGATATIAAAGWAAAASQIVSDIESELLSAWLWPIVLLLALVLIPFVLWYVRLHH